MVQLGLQIGQQLGFDASQLSLSSPQQQGNKFPWLSRNQANWIVDQTKDIKDDAERFRVQDAIYQEALNRVKKQESLQNTSNSQRDLEYRSTNANNKSERDTMKMQSRVLNLANSIRQQADGQINLSDDELVSQFVGSLPNGEELFMDYVNGKNKNILMDTWLEDPSKFMQVWQSIGRAAWRIAGGLAWATVLGNVMQWLGKMIYGVNIRPSKREAELVQRSETIATKRGGVIEEFAEWPRTKVQTALEAPANIKIRIPFTRKKVNTGIPNPFSLVGTQKAIWDQAKTIANELWQDNIQPIMDNAKETFRVDELIERAKEEINKLPATRRKEILKWLDRVIDDLWDIGELTLAQMQWEKVSIDNLSPKKVLRGEEIANAYRTAKNFLANVYRETIHNTLRENYGVDSAKIYRDYANLQELSELWIRARTEWGLVFSPWWTKTLITQIFDALGTPITSTVGKWTYQLGKLLDIPAHLKTVWRATAWFLKNPQNIKWLIRGIKNITPAWFLEPDVSASLNQARIDNIEDLLNQEWLYSGISDKELRDEVNALDLDQKAQVIYTVLDLVTQDDETLREVLPPELVDQILEIQNEINIEPEPVFENTNLTNPD